MDIRPANTSGISYLGYYCKWDRHGECPGYWADELRPGRGTRCVCPCHERLEGATGGGDAIEQP